MQITIEFERQKEKESVDKYNVDYLLAVVLLTTIKNIYIPRGLYDFER